MPIELTWYIPDRIIHIHVQGENDIAELRRFGDKFHQMLHRGKAPVHILLDDGEAGPPPFNVAALRDALRIQPEDAQALGWVIGVGDGDMAVKVIFPMLSKILGVKYTRVISLDEAVDFLQHRDLTLPRF